MKAIDNFLVEATKQYGENATISIDQAKQVLKDIKRAIGIGHIKQAGMVVDNKVKLKTVNVAKTGDLKRAFTKFAKSKTLNRQLLNKFIGQVA